MDTPALPRLPLEIQDMIIDHALRDPTTRFDLLVSLRALNRTFNAFAIPKLYAHIAFVASHAPLFGPNPYAPPPPKTSRHHYQPVHKVGLWLEVLSPAGRRVPGLDWNGGAAARQCCVERLAGHCITLDEVKLTSWDPANSPAEREALLQAIQGVTTYRRHSDGPSLSIKPGPGVSTFVGFVDIPNEYVWEGNDIVEGMGYYEKYRYLFDISASCDVLCFEKLPSHITTAVFNINMKKCDTVPTAGWLSACEGLEEVVFVVNDGLQADGDLELQCRDDEVGLGLLHFLVVAVAKAHRLRKVTFVGLDRLDNYWFGADLKLPWEAPSHWAARRDLLHAAIVDGVKRDYRSQRSPSVGTASDDGITSDAHGVETPDHPPEVAVLSLAEFEDSNTAEFFELCTTPCTFSTQS